MRKVLCRLELFCSVFVLLLSFSTNQQCYGLSEKQRKEGHELYVVVRRLLQGRFCCSKEPHSVFLTASATACVVGKGHSLFGHKSGVI